MKINWKVRFKNPMFVLEMVAAAALPLAAYFGITANQLTSWSILWALLGRALQNPYVLALMAVSAYNAVIDPTTRGMGDSDRALLYESPQGSRHE